jgi:predicted nucleic acid-binding protein
MSEFYVTVTQKITRPLSRTRAIDFLEKLRRFPVVDFDSALVFEATALQQEHEVSYWDAAIIASAHRLRAATIYSEDLNDGQFYGETRVINHSGFANSARRALEHRHRSRQPPALYSPSLQGGGATCGS